MRHHGKAVRGNGMKHQWPIIRTVLAAVTPLAIVITVHRHSLDGFTLSLGVVAWALAGTLYTQLVEYWCHRFPMHRGLPYLSNVKWNHLEHHRVFYGANFQTQDPEKLHHIVGRYWVFPILFVGHYAVLAPVLETPALVAFFLGSVLHYVVFELTHWLTHIEDNSVDRTIARLPFLADIRAYQIEHHRIHHEIPELAFNFNPPYLGDRITGHMPTGTEISPDHWTGDADVVVAPAPAVPRAIAETAPLHPVWRRRLVRYGSLAALGVAVVGAVVLARGLLTHDKSVIPTSEQTLS